MTTRQLCAYLGIGKTAFYTTVLPVFSKELRRVSIAGIERWDRRDADRIIADVKALRNPADGRLQMNKLRKKKLEARTDLSTIERLDLDARRRAHDLEAHIHDGGRA